MGQLAIGAAQGSNTSVESGYWYELVFGDPDCDCHENADDIFYVRSVRGGE